MTNKLLINGKNYLPFHYLSSHDMDPSPNNCFQVEKDDDRRKKKERDDFDGDDNGKMAQRKGGKMKDG